MAGLRERRTRPARPRLRRVLRLIGWNALFLFVGLALLAGGAEAWLRVTAPRSAPPALFPLLPAPYRESILPVRLAPGVGVIQQPHAETLYVGPGYRQAARTNSLGFLDREPPSPERAAAGCHVTLIGDSFVHGREVAIADKAQVQLEELAARDAPALDVVTSAFGYHGTAQINQLPFYDAYARRFSPDVLVLVFVANDFVGNSLSLQSYRRGFHPDYPPHLFARRGADGEMEFVPPASTMDELLERLLPLLPGDAGRVERLLREWSYFADWVWSGYGEPRPGLTEAELRASPSWAQRRAWAELVGRHPRHAEMRGWDPSAEGDDPYLAGDPLPVYRDALDVTRFALEQFRERAERDGVALVILASHTLRGEEDPYFGILREVAAGIPVLSQYDHILAAGATTGDARRADGSHWNVRGHRWAAETILEWLKRNPRVCD